MDIFYSPEDVIRTFFNAIGTRNLELLDTVWLDDDSITCMQPNQLLYTGREEIMNGFKLTFTKMPKGTININACGRWDGGVISVHNMREVYQNGKQNQPPQLSTNVLIRGAFGWRLASRHLAPFNKPPPPKEEAPRYVH